MGSSGQRPLLTRQHAGQRTNWRIRGDLLHCAGIGPVIAHRSMEFAEQFGLLVGAHLIDLGGECLGLLWQQRFQGDRGAKLLAHSLERGDTVSQHGRQVLRIQVQWLNSATQALLEVV
ncbi:hypothetical protein D3C76_1436850 [compost metagenome]